MKKICLVLALLLIAAAVPAVSAIDVATFPYTDVKQSQTFGYANVEMNDYVAYGSKASGQLTLTISHVEYFKNVHYFRAETGDSSDVKNVGSEGYFQVWYKRPSDNTYQPGILQNQKVYNSWGGVTKTYLSFWPSNWDIGSRTGAWTTTIYADNNGAPSTSSIYTCSDSYYGPNNINMIDGDSNYHAYLYMSRSSPNLYAYSYWKTHAEAYSNTWHRLTITEEFASYNVSIDRVNNGVAYHSIVEIFNSAGNTRLYNSQSTNLVSLMPQSDVAKINITAGLNKYTYDILSGETPGATPTDPTTPTVTVYVKNSQTGAAIANSNVVIDALVNGEYYPVANTTEPSGIFSITLQPTGGGQPNPDSYRLIATADGYNNPMPEINFTVTDSKKYIYCYLDPIAGGPENENNTFIDFYVRDLSANPVSGATVKFGKYTLITNSHGYTVFEVPKNTDYTYTVSKSGYGPLTGNANIGANNRYIINAVIGPAVTPTTPTAIPTDTQTGPTPTLTAPTGEPVSNLLEWFAAHFGMLLGGGVEIGKIFMWLCFTVPVGVYVGKEAKAGAAGFMAGAGIVTLFFVIIGWVPIWLVVFLALIIGLLYAKVFNSPDNGGGR